MAIPKNQLVSKSNAVNSSAAWQFNQPGYSFNQAGVEFGGSDRAQDVGPSVLEVDNIVPRNDSAILE